MYEHIQERHVSNNYFAGIYDRIVRMKRVYIILCFLMVGEQKQLAQARADACAHAIVCKGGRLFECCTVAMSTAASFVSTPNGTRSNRPPSFPILIRIFPSLSLSMEGPACVHADTTIANTRRARSMAQQIQ